MKIAMVSPYDLAWPGGVNSHVTQLSGEFAESGPRRYRHRSFVAGQPGRRRKIRIPGHCHGPFRTPVGRRFQSSRDPRFAAVPTYPWTDASGALRCSAPARTPRADFAPDGSPAFPRRQRRDFSCLFPACPSVPYDAQGRWPVAASPPWAHRRVPGRSRFRRPRISPNSLAALFPTASNFSASPMRNRSSICWTAGPTSCS